MPHTLEPAYNLKITEALEPAAAPPRAVVPPPGRRRPTGGTWCVHARCRSAHRRRTRCESIRTGDQRKAMQDPRLRPSHYPKRRRPDQLGRMHPATQRADAVGSISFSEYFNWAVPPAARGGFYGNFSKGVAGLFWFWTCQYSSPGSSDHPRKIKIYFVRCSSKSV